MWPEEALKSGKGAIEERFSLCCGHGKVAGIKLLRDPPQPLLGLYNRDHADHGHFLDNIRTYNSSFQMASTTAHLDPRSDQVPVGPGPMQFKINGEVHHRVGAALPAEGQRPRFSQIYILGPGAAAAERMAIWDQQRRRARNQPAAVPLPLGPRPEPLHLSLMKGLENMLRTHNRYVDTYISAKDSEDRARRNNEAVPDVFMTITETGEPHRGLFSSPEVGAFIPGRDKTTSYRTIYLRAHDDTVRKITNLNAAYHPLHYPLLFPYGEPGWCPMDRLLGKKVSNLAYTRFRMHQRKGESSHLLRAGPLFQEYAVDSWAQIEDQELDWYRHNQDKLFAATYSGVVDAVGAAGGWDLVFPSIYVPVSFAPLLLPPLSLTCLLLPLPSHPLPFPLPVASFFPSLSFCFPSSHVPVPPSIPPRSDDQPPAAAEVGRRVILSSKFEGCYRNTYQKYHDGMAGARKHGKSSVFLTMVANPRWQEILDALLPHQTSVDRPDLVCRVFKLKLEALLDDLLKHGALGKPVAFIHVIEYQMRGLPHAHILVTFAPEDKPHTFADYDKLCCAELPDPSADPELYATITNWHLHGPCGAALDPHSPCMKDGVCSNWYAEKERERGLIE